MQPFFKFLFIFTLSLSAKSFAEGKLPAKVATANSAAETVATQDLEEQSRKVWQEELNAAKKAQEAEAKAALTQEEFYKKKALFDTEFAAKKRKIYEYKSKEEQFAKELEDTKAELATLESNSKEIENDLKVAEERAKAHELKGNEARANFDSTKNNLKASVDKMKITRETLAKKVSQYMIDMQKLRGEISTTEAEIARADNEKVRIEDEELQVRIQWSNLKASAQAMHEDKERVLAELKDLKNHLDVAKKEFESVKAETTRAQQEKIVAEQSAAKVRAEVSAQLKKLESETADAINQKTTADAEKVRLASETEKLKGDLAFVKNRNQEALFAATDARGAVLESRLSFETAKADLVQELAKRESSHLRKDSDALKLRGIAAIEQDSQPADKLRSWVVTRGCYLRRTPATDADRLGTMKVGERLSAAPAGSGFVQVMGSSGQSVYVPKHCGYFAE